MTVSIIIPAKNEAKRIPHCLEGIYSLDANDIEVIVLDNGSSDETVDVCRNFGAQVFVQPDCTIAQLRNEGAGRAVGEILAFLDADVVMDREFLSNSLKHFEQDDVGVVTGRIAIPSESTWVQRAWDLGRRREKKLGYVPWASSMNMVVRKDLFWEVGGFTESMITCEDVDICRKFTEKGKKIIYDDTVIVTHLGEARTLAQLYYKEKWRGRSLSDINPFMTNFRELISLSQFYFFSFIIVLSLLVLMVAGPMRFLYVLPFLLSFPLLRSVKSAYLLKDVRVLGPLMAVWSVYYFARSASLWQGQIGKIMLLAGPQPHRQ